MPLTPTQILKKELRKRIRAAVRSLPAAQISSESQKTLSAFLRHPVYTSSTSVALYHPMPTEFQLLPLLSHALAHQKRVFLPRIVSKQDHEMIFLQLHCVSELDNFPCNSWGIREPPLDDGREGIPGNAEVDLVVVPGVAFDREGRRCGQGMGYYDRFLAQYSAAGNRTMPKLVALALRAQIVEQVPVDDTDWRVDHVLFAGDE